MTSDQRDETQAFKCLEDPTTSGTFTLTFRGETTEPINYNDGAERVETLLEVRLNKVLPLLLCLADPLPTLTSPRPPPHPPSAAPHSRFLYATHTRRLSPLSMTSTCASMVLTSTATAFSLCAAMTPCTPMPWSSPSSETLASTLSAGLLLLHAMVVGMETHWALTCCCRAAPQFAPLAVTEPRHADAPPRQHGVCLRWRGDGGFHN